MKGENHSGSFLIPPQAPQAYFGAILITAIQFLNCKRELLEL
jgi:hypothetical protein